MGREGLMDEEGKCFPRNLTRCVSTIRPPSLHTENNIPFCVYVIMTLDWERRRLSINGIRRSSLHCANTIGSSIDGRDVNNGIVSLSAKILCQTGVSCRGQSKFINGRKTDPLVSILMAHPQAKRERERGTAAPPFNRFQSTIQCPE